MGIFSRFSDIVNSNIHAILDKAEDPEKLVRLMIQEMEETLVEVRSAAARAIADQKQLQRRLRQLLAERDEWTQRAELAVGRGRDDLARAALEEKARTSAEVEILEQEDTALETGLERLREDMSRLEEKLTDARNRQKALLARHGTASNRMKLREKVNDGRIDDALIRFENFERRIDQMEGRVEAWDLEDRKDLKSQFRNLESESQVDEELADLKRRLDKRSGSAANAGSE